MDEHTTRTRGERRGWIRWPGLVAFIVIVGGVWLGGWLFADTLARVALERTLTRIQGAQVDIAALDVGWQPFGLSLEGLAMTNADEPARNTLELAEADAHLDFLALLTGKVTIERLSVRGLELDTERAQPGRVLSHPATTRKDDTSTGKGNAGADGGGPAAEPGLGERLAGTVTLPDGATALAAIQPLAVQTRAATATATSEEVLAQLQQTADAVPDRAQLEAYRQRLTALRQRDLESVQDIEALRTELRALRADVRADRAALGAQVERARAGREEMDQAIRALSQAPAADLARLRERYDLGVGSGQIAVVELLLGPQWADWLASGQVWYDRAQPWLARLADLGPADDKPVRAPAGRYVRFPEADARPGFWLRQADIEWLSPMGGWDVRLVDLSSDQTLLDRPTVLSAQSDRLDQAASGSLDLVWDTRAAAPGLTLDFQLTDWHVRGWELGGDSLTLGLDSALTQLDLQAQYQSQWQGELNWRFAQADFAANATAAEGIGRLVSDALSDVRVFQVRADLSGSRSVPRTAWSSDLGARVNQAVTTALQKRYAELEAEAREQLLARRDALLEPVRGNRAQLDTQLESLQARQATLEEELSAGMLALEQRLDKARQELEDRVRDQAEQGAREVLEGFRF